MAKKIYILLFVVIGLIMGPQSALARHIEATKVCCQQMSPDKSCCKESKKEMTKKHSCKGGCGSCSCAYSVDVKTPLFAPLMENAISFVFSVKQQKYFYLEMFHANAARDIWLPPKIG